MDKEEKIKKLKKELKKLEGKLIHLQKEFTATKSGSAYGVEYYDIQIKVYETMVLETKGEILRLKEGG